MRLIIHTALLAPLLSIGAAFCVAGNGAADLAGDDEALGIRAVWRTITGAAYSRVAVRGDTVVTLASDGEQDWAVAMNEADGSVRWRTRLGPVYLGHDGSEDGPISTPAMNDELVFALDPLGQLSALDLRTGEPRWTTHLVDDLGAELPEYGFTTSPLVEGDVLVLQVGGDKNRNLCGFDAKTGELRWSLGTGEAGYQSPVVLDLAGRRQLVVLNGGELQGVAPENGELLWSHPLAERDRASTGRAGRIDDERFYLYVSGRVAILAIVAADGGYEVEELVRTRELGNTYGKPVHHEGHLYGFQSTFLTCVNVETGRRVWKSRPPGGTGLALVGDHLAVFGAEGVVAVVRATPEGYLEESRITALDHSGYAWPTSAGERIFVRNSDEVACLELFSRRDVATTAAAAGSGAIEGHAFGAFLNTLVDVRDAGALIDAFLAEQSSFPILEGDLVHIVYRGEAEDVAVRGSMTGGSRADSLERVPGTDLFHRTFRIAPGARWEYGFQLDFGDVIVDPLNPRTTPGRRGPSSELVTPGYESAAHLAEPAGPRGKIESFEFASEQIDNTRTLQVYLPAGYDASEASYPLILVHDGPDWIERGLMTNTLDNLIGASVRPVVVAFVPPIDDWWFEAGGSRTEEYVAMLATELVPTLESRYRLSDDPADRALFGVRGFGLTALFGAVAHPGVFGKAAAQSASLEDVTRHAFFAQLAAEPTTDSRFYVDWSHYEPHNEDRGYDFRAYGPRLFEALTSAKCNVTGGEALDSHGWGGWRARTDDWLEAFFPMQ